MLAEVRAWLKERMYRMVMSAAFLPIVMVLAFLLRFVWVEVVTNYPISDFRWYFDRGVEIANGLGFALPGAGGVRVPVASNPPGYPLFLAVIFKVFGASMLVAKIMNAVLQMGALYCVYALARDLFRSEFAGRVALTILAFYPNGIAYTSIIANESLFMAIYLGATLTLLAALRGKSLWWGICSGAAWGYAGLIKPQVLALPILILLLYAVDAFRRRQGWHWAKVSALTVLAMALLVVPWIVRNALVLGKPVMNTTVGQNLFMGNCPDTNGGWVALWSPDNPRTAAMLPPMQPRELDNDIAARNAAMRYLRAHPERLYMTAGAKMRCLYGWEDGVYWNQYYLEKESPRLQGFLSAFGRIGDQYYVLLGVGFVLAVLILPWQPLARRRRVGLPAIGIATVLFFTAICIITYGRPRYHMPMIPWAAIYIGGLLRSAVQPDDTRLSPDDHARKGT
jgi:4-amino-4-deoxy-L-arabinose transferase-like glycosyltransferase